MAANLSQKRALPVDYKQLNLFSSTVLFDTARKLKKGEFYEVERIFEPVICVYANTTLKSFKV